MIRARNLCQTYIGEKDVLRDLILIRARNWVILIVTSMASFKRPDFDKG